MITNCRKGQLSANQDRKKNFTISQEKLYNFSWSQIAEKDHFLQITITRNTLQFLKKNHTIFRDRKLQKRTTFCKSRSQEILYNFLRKTIQFLVIANCRKGPLSANHDRKKNFTICQEKLYNFSWSRIAEKDHFLQITIARNTLHFLRKTIQFFVIANCRTGPFSANHDLKKCYAVFLENYMVSNDRNFQKLTLKGLRCFT